MLYAQIIGTDGDRNTAVLKADLVVMNNTTTKFEPARLSSTTAITGGEGGLESTVLNLL
jgi:hypothetical protein